MSIGLERNGRRYGDHQLIGDQGDAFFNKSSLGRALDLGWSDGCPVAVSLAKPPEEGGRGAEVMAKRYGPVNFWLGYISKVLINSQRLDLQEQLMPIAGSPRAEGEAIGKHDENWVPSELSEKVLVTHAAYSLPRVLIAYLNDPQINSLKERQERTFTTMSLLEQTARDANNINDFLVRFTQSLVLSGGDPAILLKNMLSQGKLNEDNCLSDYRKVVQRMKEDSILYNIYKEIPEEEKQKLGIADIIGN